jgi:hypothetical protein
MPRLLISTLAVIDVGEVGLGGQCVRVLSAYDLLCCPHHLELQLFGFQISTLRTIRRGQPIYTGKCSWMLFAKNLLAS